MGPRKWMCRSDSEPGGFFGFKFLNVLLNPPPKLPQERPTHTAGLSSWDGELSAISTSLQKQSCTQNSLLQNSAGFVLALMFGSGCLPASPRPALPHFTLSNSLQPWAALGAAAGAQAVDAAPPSLLLNQFTLQPSQQLQKQSQSCRQHWGLCDGLGVLSIFSALTQGHQQNILGMSGQTEAASIVFTKGRGGFGISVKG